MKALQFIKTNYKYCIIGEHEHQEYPYLNEIKNDEEKNKNKNIHNLQEHYKEEVIDDEDKPLDNKTMILYSLPSFGKMSSLVMLK